MNTTSRTTRLAGLLVAVVITTVINGAMLLKFDAAAHEGTEQYMTQVSGTDHQG